MSFVGFTCTVRVMVERDVLDNDVLMDNMASYLEAQLEGVDHRMAEKYVGKYSHLDIEFD